MSKDKEKDSAQINHFRARIEIYLRQKGWSFRDLAKAMGRSPQSLRYIINAGDPKVSVLESMAGALDVTPDDLLEEVTTEEYGEAFLPTSI